MPLSAEALIARSSPVCAKPYTIIHALPSSSTLRSSHPHGRASYTPPLFLALCLPPSPLPSLGAMARRCSPSLRPTRPWCDRPPPHTPSHASRPSLLSSYQALHNSNTIARANLTPPSRRFPAAPPHTSRHAASACRCARQTPTHRCLAPSPILKCIASPSRSSPLYRKHHLPLRIGHYSPHAPIS